MEELTGPFYFEDLEIGLEWESEGREVTGADVFGFAEMTGDRNPIHVDPAFASGTPFRRCIAHGLLGLSLAGGLTTQSPALRTLAFIGLKEWNFRLPIFPGDTIRTRTQVLHKEPRQNGRRGEVTWRCRVFNQDGKVVQEGVTVLLVEARGGHRPRRRSEPVLSDQDRLAC